MSDFSKYIFSNNKNKVTEAFFHIINQNHYFLSENDLNAIDDKFVDEKVSAWVFAYRAYTKSLENRNEFLRLNISNKNPRIREQVCDIIGDEFIDDLRNELKQLFDDPVPYVSQAARYNHDEMF